MDIGTMFSAGFQPALWIFIHTAMAEVWIIPDKDTQKLREFVMGKKEASNYEFSFNNPAGKTEGNATINAKLSFNFNSNLVESSWITNK